MITDCRFVNEAQWIVDNGGLLIRVEAPSRNGLALQQESMGDPLVYDAISSHPSETALDKFIFTYRINNEPERALTVSYQVESIIKRYLSGHLDRLHHFNIPIKQKPDRINYKRGTYSL